MTYFVRNAAVATGVGLVWAYFFVPNPWMSVLAVEGIERVHKYVLLGVVPVTLAVIVMFASKGTLLTRIGLIACVPLFGFAIYLLTSAIGVYSDEGLIGYWLALPFSVAAYLIGAAVAAGIYWTNKRPQSVAKK